jgi:hypothetical protein
MGASHSGSVANVVSDSSGLDPYLTAARLSASSTETCVPLEVYPWEHHATLSLPGPGTYDYAYRFSGDGGTTFTYCDGRIAGSADGYQPANAGQMTSTPR